MGCSICLDPFGEDTEKGTRPVALPCGHVFHKACSDAWLKACRIKNDPACCPLCKHQLGSARPLTLWPSDFRDLDTYLTRANKCVSNQVAGTSSRPTRVISAAAALDRHMSREDQGKLLGNLLDFQRHVSSYVMGVNNVSVHEYGGKGQRMFALMHDMTQDDVASNELETSVNALTAATNVFKEALNSLEEMKRDVVTKNEQAIHDFHKASQMKESFRKHLQTKEVEERRMQVAAESSRRLYLHLQKEIKAVEEAKRKLKEDRQLYDREIKEKLKEANKARLEAAQAAAQSKGEADSKINDLTKYVQDQEALRMIADERTRDAVKKNNFLADRIKLLDRKLAAARKEAKANSVASSSRSERDRLDSTVQDTKGKMKQESGSQDGYDPDTLEYDATTSELEALSRRLARSRPSANVGTQLADPVIIDDDDLDVEVRDATFHRPFYSSSFAPNWRGHRTSSMVRTQSVPNRPQMSLSRSHVSLDDDDDDDDDVNDGSVEFVGKKRRLNGHEVHGQDEVRSGTPSALDRPFLPGPISSSDGHSGGGMHANMPTNSALANRSVQGSVQTGPRRRVR